MAWIESHQQLARHPKTIRLAAKLRIHKAQAIGHLHLLWWWTLDYAPSGDLSAFASCEIGAAAEWTGDAEGFATALMESGWLDPNKFVHDWHDYAGKLVEQRAKDRQRKREVREIPQEFHGKSDGIPKDGGSTQPNPTQHTQPNPTYPTRKPVAVAPSVIPESLILIPGFETEWSNFIDHRKAKGKVTERAKELILQTLSERPQQSVQALQEAITRGWSGIKWDWIDKGNGAAGAKQSKAHNEYRLTEAEMPKSWNPMTDE